MTVPGRERFYLVGCPLEKFCRTSKGQPCYLTRTRYPQHADAGTRAAARWPRRETELASIRIGEQYIQFGNNQLGIAATTAAGPPAVLVLAMLPPEGRGGRLRLPSGARRRLRDARREIVLPSSA